VGVPCNKTRHCLSCGVSGSGAVFSSPSSPGVGGMSVFASGASGRFAVFRRAIAKRIAEDGAETGAKCRRPAIRRDRRHNAQTRGARVAPIFWPNSVRNPCPKKPSRRKFCTASGGCTAAPPRTITRFRSGRRRTRHASIDCAHAQADAPEKIFPARVADSERSGTNVVRGSSSVIGECRRINLCMLDRQSAKLALGIFA